ncbi:MAG: NHLP bacteriocin system secretion protein [Roseiflexaceae bacterium]|nr:NHLP bacteriocin system secretion protein [Roseiflexaceae bacterium]
MQKPNISQPAQQPVSSPEHLDQLLRVTTLPGWVALGALSALLLAAIIWGVAGTIATTVTGDTILLRGGRVYGVIAPVAGEISGVFVKVGDLVTEGQVVAIMTPPNSLDSAQITRIASSYTGRVVELRAERGSIVVPSDTLMSLEATDLPLEAIVYLPPAASANVRPGMDVQVLPANVAKEEYGFLRGQVTSVAAFPSTSRGMALTIAHEELVDQFMVNGPPVEVRVALLADTTPSGYRWSYAAGPPFEIRSGVLGRAQITLEEQRPIGFVLPVLR